MLQLDFGVHSGRRRVIEGSSDSSVLSRGSGIEVLVGFYTGSRSVHGITWFMGGRSLQHPTHPKDVQSLCMHA